MTQQSSGGNQIVRKDIGGHRGIAAAADDNFATSMND